MLVSKKKVFMVVAVAFLMVLVGVSSTFAADITLGYVEWDCAISQTHIVAAVLEEHLGLDVELVSVDAGIMWTGLAQGDLDAIVCAWLPVTHGFYWDTYQDNLINLGKNFDGAKIGLVVPEYVEIDSIEELNSNARNFKSLIYGIDPGAGIMAATDDALAAYDLNFNVIDSSDAAMVIQLGQAIARKEWIVVTGWIPHWKFDSYDLKFLEDPQNIYGDAESIHTIARKDFYDDFSPEVVQLLENFYLTQPQLHEMMNIIRESGKDELNLAKEWIKANSDVVEAWF